MVADFSFGQQGYEGNQKNKKEKKKNKEKSIANVIRLCGVEMSFEDLFFFFFFLGGKIKITLHPDVTNTVLLLECTTNLRSGSRVREKIKPLYGHYKIDS